MNSNLLPGRWVWLILGAVGLLLLIFLMGARPEEETIPITALLEKVRAGEVATVSVASDNVTVGVVYKSGAKDVVYKESNTSILDVLARAGVGPDYLPVVQVDAPGRGGALAGMMVLLIPIAVAVGLFVFLGYLARQPRGTDRVDAAFSFARSGARCFSADRPRVTFGDVAGVEEAKEELSEVVEFLKHSERFARLGARIPRGVLLVGPPGTGKTLLAKAVAGEASVSFFSISGSEFVEVFVGVGASRVRDLFTRAKRVAPCIVFVDEIDAVGRHRGAGPGGHDERDQTLNQILVEMDGFDSSTNVIVMAATNRPDVLDPALLRPGRFDRQVVLDRPDAKGRLDILQVHAREKRLAPDVDLKALARTTAGFSGADLENTLNEAAILAARHNKLAVTMEEISEAVDRVVAGPQRKSRVLSAREKQVIAYHEMGHALVAHTVAHADPVHKVSIVARGVMGGYTRLLPSEDRYLWTKSQLVDTLAFTLGGLGAEELTFGEISSGGANDIEKATELARRMACEYGMSEKLGLVALGRRQDAIFVGRDSVEQRNYGDEAARQIDEEVRRFIDDAYERARRILLAHQQQLGQVVELLMERETLEGEELQQALGIPHQASSKEEGLADLQSELAVRTWTTPQRLASAGPSGVE